MEKTQPKSADAARIIRLLYTTDITPPLKADLKKSPRLQLAENNEYQTPFNP
ncbi:hypothetical protein [Parapedobacter soli]|uniref:hypothetical protein n=1 Tax=Parapedobacter soli TaxID=416955 RepID=UPI0021CA2E2D|nr:hypothetical protein [Parapedobacter soli]